MSSDGSDSEIENLVKQARKKGKENAIILPGEYYYLTFLWSCLIHIIFLISDCRTKQWSLEMKRKRTCNNLSRWVLQVNFLLSFFIVFSYWYPLIDDVVPRNEPEIETIKQTNEKRKGKQSAFSDVPSRRTRSKKR